MGILLSLGAIVYAILVLKDNKPLLNTDQDLVAKANYVIAILAIVLVICFALSSAIAAIVALVILKFRKPLIDLVFTKMSS
jgi:hypothetical protein